MQSKLRILLSGDVSLTGVYHDPVAREVEIFDPGIIALFRQHDFTVINLEGPATAAKQVRRPDLQVVSPSNSIPYLAARGINVFNLANNHILDCGVEGFRDTVGTIDACGCRRFGAGFDAAEAGSPLYLSRNGVTVALLGVCNFQSTAAGLRTPYGTFYDDSIKAVKQVVTEARKHADYVILNYHGGEEYTTVPMPSRRRRLHEYAELGFDAIVGHHSHTFQGHERHAGCDIFYSLGNFVFDVDVLRSRQFTDKSALLSLGLQDQGLTFEFIPIQCDWTRGRVALADGAFREHIAAISDFSNFRRLWRRDAFRTYFQRRPANSDVSSSDQAQPSRKRPRWKYLLRPSSYSRLYRQLKNDMVRPILIGALAEAVLRFPRRIWRR